MNVHATLRNVIMVSFLVILSTYGFAQSPFPVVGKVTNTEGQPLSGVTVQVKGSNVSTVSNANGTYQINVPSPDTELVFSSVGFVQQEAKVNSRGQINIFMAPQVASMENVVVIGYGTQKRRNVTAAVSNFNAENLEQRPLTRVDQALVGQMAGVQVRQTTGTPGRAFSIQVRGSGSITAGNEPLYVIDGFPLATAAPNAAGNFSTGNPLDNINPNDIESIQVLKDAAAAAIYGSRAANGVVLITTKKGRSGKPKVSLNSYSGYNAASRKLDMLNGPEWIDRAIEMINAAYVTDYGTYGASPNDNNEQRRVIINKTLPAASQLQPGALNTGYMLDPRWLDPAHPGLRFINWQDEAFRKGFIQNHQLSASGGSEFVRYYLSANFADQNGFVKGMDYRQYSGRANLEVIPNSKIRFGINVAPTYSTTNDPGVEGKDNILHQLASMTPVQEDTMGLYPNAGNNGQYRWGVSTNSPIAKLEQVIGLSKRFRTIASLFGELQPIRGLVLKSTINLDNTDNNTKSYNPYTIASNVATRQAQLTQLTSGSFSGFRKQTIVNENTVSYNTTLNDVHDISLLGGFSYNQDKIDNVRISSQNGFSSAVITTLNYASAVTGSTTETKNVLVSYFGRIQYSFQDRYLLSASLRRDGASRFGTNSKWGTFPSASIGWRIIEEDFMKNISGLSDLKLRASWGRSGNYNIGDYPSIPVLGIYNYTFNNLSTIGQAPASITNPDISWEKSETFDVGLDIGILRNRITATIDYYNKHNTNLLLNVPIPQASGFPILLSNAGAARNTGWELELTSRNMRGGFQWTTTANLSHNANKVEALAGGQSQIIIPSAFANAQHSILRVGEPMYSIYVVKQIGILSQEDISNKVARFGNETVGDPKYFDANNDGVIDLDDRVIVGHPNPDYVWGVTNNFRYKGFDLNVLVQGQWGGSIYSLLGRALSRTGQGVSDNPLGTYRERWRSPENPGAGRVSKAFSRFGTIANTDWLYPSDYVRVRNITLGYDLGSALKTKVISAFRIYATAENFFGWDKYKGGWNPE
ncbi:MAG: TonB-dependent receptor, partial [Flavisolibacter sp.]|nr:TonB-dependent receptor [Flavisolibacter sp.]